MDRRVVPTSLVRARRFLSRSFVTLQGSPDPGGQPKSGVGAQCDPPSNFLVGVMRMPVPSNHHPLAFDTCAAQRCPALPIRHSPAPRPLGGVQGVWACSPTGLLFLTSGGLFSPPVPPIFSSIGNGTVSACRRGSQRFLTGCAELDPEAHDPPAWKLHASQDTWRMLKSTFPAAAYCLFFHAAANLEPQPTEAHSRLEGSLAGLCT